jgi:hypothetical protein
MRVVHPVMRVVHPASFASVGEQIGRGRIAAAQELLYARHPVPRWFPRRLLSLATVGPNSIGFLRLGGLRMLISPRRETARPA